jgi:hypothetical protein
MSQFFDQYNAILEKSLQRVRLRVDPNVKYAEDFAQYDGYVGYILAETDDSFDFFYGDNTVTLPKNAVFVEGVGDFIRGAAGQNTGSSVSGALGSIASSALKGAARAGLAMHGIPSNAYSSSSSRQQSNSQQNTQPGSQLKFGSNVDRSHSFAIKTANGNAVIEINGAKYGIIKGSITDGNKKVLLNSFTFDNMINFHLVALNEASPFSNFPSWAGQGMPPKGANIPTAPTTPAATTAATSPTTPAATTAATSPTTPAASTTPTATTQTQPQTSVPTPAFEFTPISEITVANLKQKNALMVPLQVSLLPIDGAKAKDLSPKTHGAMFTVAPNGQEVLFNFLD